MGAGCNLGAASPCPHTRHQHTRQSQRTALPLTVPALLIALSCSLTASAAAAAQSAPQCTIGPNQQRFVLLGSAATHAAAWQNKDHLASDFPACSALQLTNHHTVRLYTGPDEGAGAEGAGHFHQLPPPGPSSSDPGKGSSSSSTGGGTSRGVSSTGGSTVGRLWNSLWRSGSSSSTGGGTKGSTGGSSKPKGPSLKVLLHEVGLLLPCKPPACSRTQQLSFRRALHAAAHGMLSHYCTLPPNITMQQPGTTGSNTTSSTTRNALGSTGPKSGDKGGGASSAGGSGGETQQQQQQQQRPGVLPAAARLTPLSHHIASHLRRLFSEHVTPQGQGVHCRWDPSLPPLPGVLHLPPDDRRWGNDSEVGAAEQAAARTSPARYLLAFNLRSSSAIMPHFTLHALALATYLPPDSVLVSSYESGSNDATPEWLGVVQGLLDLAGIPSRIVAKGPLVRAWGQQRIDYLAAVRNEAIAPLTSPALCEAALTRVAPAAAPPSPRLLRDAKGRSSGSSNGSSSGKGSSSSIKGSSGSSAAGRRAGAGSRGARGVRSSDSSSGNGSVTKSTNGTNGTRSEACATGFPATKVLFLNDVYFCWQDVVRLVLHDVDMACGLDFDSPPPPSPPGPGRRRLGQQHGHTDTAAGAVPTIVSVAGGGAGTEAEAEASEGGAGVGLAPDGLWRDMSAAHPWWRPRLLIGGSDDGSSINGRSGSSIDGSSTYGSSDGSSGSSMSSADSASGGGKRVSDPGMWGDKHAGQISDLQPEGLEQLITPWWGGEQAEQQLDQPQTGRRLSEWKLTAETADYKYYDIWVGRDIKGQRMEKGHPIMKDAWSMSRLRRGLPTPVQCCWNGLVVLNAAPFRRHLNHNHPPPTTFENSASNSSDANATTSSSATNASTAGDTRAGSQASQSPSPQSSSSPSAVSPPVKNTQPPPPQLLFHGGRGGGECAASECSLMCNDFWKAGARRVVVDPYVRVTYVPFFRTKLHDQLMGGVPMLGWGQLQEGGGAGSQQELHSLWTDPATAPPQSVDCCPIRPNQDWVNWGTCQMQSGWMGP